MQKVVVIGSGGSGKSTFSRRLGEATGLPVVHLDRLFWRPGWVKTPADEWEEIVRRELEKPEWIMDGNFGGTRKMRFEACDTVILLDLPRYLCIYRILKRTILFRNKRRPDMADGCPERFDPEFLSWIWTYPSSGRVRAVNDLSQVGSKAVYVLQSRQEIERFLNNLPGGLKT